MRTIINGLGNIIMKPLLRSRLHFFASKRIMLITFTGRKSGKRYTTPTEYRQEGSMVKLFTQKDRVWWKNLQNDAPVTLRLHGKDFNGRAGVPGLDRTSLHSEMHKMYPAMSSDQIAQLAPKLVMVQVQLADQPAQAASSASRSA